MNLLCQVNASHRLATNYYPNGQKSVFSYFGASSDFRLQQIAHSTPTTNLSTFSYTYDPDGQIQTWTQQAGNGTPKVWGLEYDPVDQLLAATVRSNSITGAILKRYVYNYDTAGNRLSEQIDLGVTKANYNELNQLTNTLGGGPVRFAGRLSEMGTVQVAGSPAVMGIQNTSFVAYAQTSLGTNIINITATDYSTNTASTNYQIVVTNSGVTKTLSYDLNGNLTNMSTAISTNSYEWDAANRLTKIYQLSTLNYPLTSEFTYDGLGRRVRIVEKTNGIVQSDHRFLWVGTELSEERDSTGSTVTKRFFGQGEQISGTNYFFTRDHLGSVREMTDNTGAIQARYEFDPYGRRTKSQGEMEADFSFTGFLFHQASGAYLTLFRVYNTDTGRWISRDPIGETSGFNLYLYVQNNSINLFDSYGLEEDRPYMSKYETQDKAAIGAMQFLSKNYLEVQGEYWEQGIVIFQAGKTFYFNLPTHSKQLRGQALFDFTDKLNKEDKAVAVVHDHIKGEDFSRPKDDPKKNDIRLLQDREVDGYVLTPSGKMKKYDLKTGKTTTLPGDCPPKKMSP